MNTTSKTPERKGVLTQCMIVHGSEVRREVMVFLEPKHAVTGQLLERKTPEGSWEPGWRVEVVYGTVQAKFMREATELSPSNVRAQKES